MSALWAAVRHGAGQWFLLLVFVAAITWALLMVVLMAVAKAREVLASIGIGRGPGL